jgi:hypothetical protein
LVRGIPRMAVKGPRQSAVPPSSHPNFYIMAPLALNKDNVNAPTSRQASLVNAALPSDASIEANALEAVSLSGPPDLASPWTEFATVVNDGRAQALSMPLLPTPSFLLELYSQRERDAPQELERRRQQDKQVQNAADLWNVLQNQTPTQVHAPAQFRATE